MAPSSPQRKTTHVRTKRSRGGSSRTLVWVSRVVWASLAVLVWANQAGINKQIAGLWDSLVPGDTSEVAGMGMGGGIVSRGCDGVDIGVENRTGCVAEGGVGGGAKGGAWWGSVLFQLESFEPLLATSSFLVVLAVYYGLDNLMPRSVVSYFHIHPEESHNMVSWKVQSPGRIQELLAYIVPLAAFDLLFPRRMAKLGDFPSPPTVFQIVFEVVSCFLVYDVLFFAGHSAMHAIPALYKALHAKHHTRTLQRAIETVRLSLIEQALDVSCSIAAVNLTRAHPLSRAIYVPLIVLALCDLHSGYDWPFSLENVLPQRFWGGAVHHDVHHRDGRFHLAKFTHVWDWCFGLHIDQRRKVQ